MLPSLSQRTWPGCELANLRSAQKASHFEFCRPFLKAPISVPGFLPNNGIDARNGALNQSPSYLLPLHVFVLESRSAAMSMWVAIDKRPLMSHIRISLRAANGGDRLSQIRKAAFTTFRHVPRNWKSPLGRAACLAG